MLEMSQEERGASLGSQREDFVFAERSCRCANPEQDAKTINDTERCFETSDLEEDKTTSPSNSKNSSKIEISELENNLSSEQQQGSRINDEFHSQRMIIDPKLRTCQKLEINNSRGQSENYSRFEHQVDEGDFVEAKMLDRDGPIDKKIRNNCQKLETDSKVCENSSRFDRMEENFEANYGERFEENFDDNFEHQMDIRQNRKQTTPSDENSFSSCQDAIRRQLPIIALNRNNLRSGRNLEENNGDETSRRIDPEIEYGSRFVRNPEHIISRQNTTNSNKGNFDDSQVSVSKMEKGKCQCHQMQPQPQILSQFQREQAHHHHHQHNNKMHKISQQRVQQSQNQQQNYRHHHYHHPHQHLGQRQEGQRSQSDISGGRKQIAGSDDNLDEIETIGAHQPPALPPRPPPRPTRTFETSNIAAYDIGPNGAEDSGCCKKYVVLCCLCGGLSAAVGSLFLAVHAVLSAHTASLALFETVPSYIPGTMLILMGLFTILLARRKHRYGFLMKMCGSVGVVCALVCVLVTVTTTVVHMSRLQGLRECIYTEIARSCTCYGSTQGRVLPDPGVLFEETPHCEAVHGALYDCLRALFGVSVAGILACIFSCMLLYQLLSHEKKKMYWEQLQLRCRSLYGQAGGITVGNSGSCGCCNDCAAGPAGPWWAQNPGNLYTPNPDLPFRRWRLPWSRARGPAPTPDSNYGFHTRGPAIIAPVGNEPSDNPQGAYSVLGEDSQSPGTPYSLFPPANNNNPANWSGNSANPAGNLIPTQWENSRNLANLATNGNTNFTANFPGTGANFSLTPGSPANVTGGAGATFGPSGPAFSGTGANYSGCSTSVASYSLLDNSAVPALWGPPPPYSDPNSPARRPQNQAAIQLRAQNGNSTSATPVLNGSGTRVAISKRTGDNFESGPSEDYRQQRPQTVRPSDNYENSEEVLSSSTNADLGSLHRHHHSRSDEEGTKGRRTRKALKGVENGAFQQESGANSIPKQSESELYFGDVSSCCGPESSFYDVALDKEQQQTGQMEQGENLLDYPASSRLSKQRQSSKRSRQPLPLPSSLNPENPENLTGSKNSVEDLSRSSTRGPFLAPDAQYEVIAQQTRFAYYSPNNGDHVLEIPLSLSSLSFRNDSDAEINEIGLEAAANSVDYSNNDRLDNNCQNRLDGSQQSRLENCQNKGKILNEPAKSPPSSPTSNLTIRNESRESLWQGEQRTTDGVCPVNV